MMEASLYLGPDPGAWLATAWDTDGATKRPALSRHPPQLIFYPPWRLQPVSRNWNPVLAHPTVFGPFTYPLPNPPEPGAPRRLSYFVGRRGPQARVLSLP